MKKEKYFCCFLIAMIVLVAIIRQFIALIPLVSLFLLVITNRHYRKALFLEKGKLDGNINFRNMKGIIIADSSYSHIQSSNMLCIQYPGMSLREAFILLKTYHSVLNEEGGADVIIAVKQDLKNFTFLLPYYLHSITIKKYNLKFNIIEMLFPFLYHPIFCILFTYYRLFPKKYKESIPDSEISSFCKKRHYNFKLLYKI